MLIIGNEYAVLRLEGQASLPIKIMIRIIVLINVNYYLFSYNLFGQTNER